MAIRIVVDSGSDITPRECEELGITVLPLTVSFGNVQYLDSVNLTHTEFYEKLIESDELPTTSQVNPAQFGDVFKELTDKGDTVIAIILSGSLSGTYQSACIAADDYPGKVYVVDSKNVTVATRVLVLRALNLIKEGLDAEKIVSILEEEKKDVRVLAILDTLEYLKKGGRISPTVAFAGSLLNIKPVVTVDENGYVGLIGKARGSKNGNNLLRKLIEDCGGIDFSHPVGVAYSGLSDIVLQKYLEDHADIWAENAPDLKPLTIGCAIGTHVGPGAIAVAFFVNKK